MKKLYLTALVLMLFFTCCDKKETITPAPENIEEQLKGKWKEVETTVKEYDINNNLLGTTPNISPASVVFDGKDVTTTYAESFIDEHKTSYTLSKSGDKYNIIYTGDHRLYEITEISAAKLTLVVKQMGTEFNGARFHYILYTRKLTRM